eukprot:3127634-Rhodomonas_salina.1
MLFNPLHKQNSTDLIEGIKPFLTTAVDRTCFKQYEKLLKDGVSQLSTDFIISLAGKAWMANKGGKGAYYDAELRKLYYRHIYLCVGRTTKNSLRKPSERSASSVGYFPASGATLVDSEERKRQNLERLATAAHERRLGMMSHEIVALGLA